MSAGAPYYNHGLVATPDPGTGVAIPVDTSQMVSFTIAAGESETNTVPDPKFAGQMLFINVNSLGLAGSRALTFSNAFLVDDTTGLTMTFNATSHMAFLLAIRTGGNLRWMVIWASYV